MQTVFAWLYGSFSLSLVIPVWSASFLTQQPNMYGLRFCVAVRSVLSALDTVGYGQKPDMYGDRVFMALRSLLFLWVNPLLARFFVDYKQTCIYMEIVFACCLFGSVIAATVIWQGVVKHALRRGRGRVHVVYLYANRRNVPHLG